MEYDLLRFFVKSYLYIEPDGDALRAVNSYYSERGSKALVELAIQIQELLATDQDDFKRIVNAEELSIINEDPSFVHRTMWDVFGHIRTITGQKWF